ncbi:sensor histidine kinase [Duganella callida]|uniref:Histidine kinase domain-containing protein n=1 Tax=Duganella callida TaxID=2561932 RepID=A0A4Y9SQB5_9BURK|nr:ATP-binding protein [Duganella callida]TFW26291.1 hypothetical protein E4L98_08610 [Duganella callida]
MSDQLLFTERQNERSRIARILHDHFLQQCQLILCTLQALAARATLSAADRQELDSLARDTDEAMTLGRQLILELRQAGDGVTLAQRLDLLGGALCARARIRFTCTLQPALALRHDAWADDIYILLAEALRNAVRHARAGTISVTSVQTGDGLAVTVADDGIGIPAAILNGSPPSLHFGLTGMRERAQLLGARLEIASHAGGGTSVTLRFDGAPPAVKE